MNTQLRTKKLNFRAKPVGATAVEYMIMLILIALFIIGIMRVFGDTISNKVARASGSVETMGQQSGSAATGVGGEAAGGSGAVNGGGSGNGNSGSGANGAGKGGGKGSASASGKNGNGSGSGSGSGKGSKGSSGKNGGLKNGRKVAMRGSAESELIEPEDSGPGINPIVLLIALGLLGLLIYVMVANKKGS